MASSDDTPVFTTGTTYSRPQSSPGFWDKVSSGLDKVAGYAREALPYLAQATSNYASSSGSGNASRDVSNSLIYQPTHTELATVKPIPIRPVSVKPVQSGTIIQKLNALHEVNKQLSAGINPAHMHTTLLAALSQGTAFPNNSQHTSSKVQGSTVHASSGSLLPPQNWPTSTNEPQQVREQTYPIVGAQKPVSYTQLPQASQADSFMPFNLPSAAPLSSTAKLSPIKSQQISHQAPRTQISNASVSDNSAYGFLDNSYRGPVPSPKRAVLNFPGIQEFKNYPKDMPLTNWYLKPKTYPDITKNQQIYVKFITDIVKQNQPGALQYISRFRPGGVWDLKGQPGIPPAGRLAYYKGAVVTDAYLANNAYGNAMGAAGYSLQITLDYADNASLFSRRKFDQPEDQAAIISGWFEYYVNDPWITGLPDPHDFAQWKEKAPNTYQKYERNFQDQQSIKQLLQKADMLYKRKLEAKSKK